MIRRLKFIQIFVFITCCSRLFAQVEKIRIPVGGNSWIKNGTSENIAESGLMQWSSASAIIETYVKLESTGKVKIYLAGKISGKSTIVVTVLGESKQVNLEGTRSEFGAGEWEIRKPGYLKITLKGVSKTAETFGEISELVLEGAGLQTASFVKDSKDNYFYWGRRGPSVHLNYPVPADEKIEWFYNEVTVPEKQDVIGSYFMADGFGEGYFGMQVNSANERRVLFSVWSPFKTDDPGAIPKDKQIVMLKKGKEVHTGEFGNEGAGGQSYLKYNWKAGNTYRFLLSGKPTGDSTTTYTAYFFAPEEGNWRLIASFKRPKTDTYLTKLHSFLENFIPETGDLGRTVNFGNQWICNDSGKWTELNQAKFSADATARKGYRMDYAGGKDNGQFFLKNCGFFDQNTKMGEEFARTKTGKQPVIDFKSLP